MTPIQPVEVGSGGSKVLVRLPSALHKQIKAVASEQGVSVNTMIATLLAGGVGFRLKRDG
jgi:predicted HicB family RNase H-like nuclease